LKPLILENIGSELYVPFRPRLFIAEIPFSNSDDSRGRLKLDPGEKTGKACGVPPK
jgi:hypothetical protein